MRLPFYPLALVCLALHALSIDISSVVKQFVTRPT